MADLTNMTKEQLEARLAALEAAYDDYKARNLKLDMSRGKPGPEQLDLSMALLDTVNEDNGAVTASGVDTRNYGMLEGIAECRKMFAELFQVEPEQVIVGGNSSLNMMFDYIAQAYSHGVCGGAPWCREEKVKFLCPAPGYDRHFQIGEFFGAELIPVPMTPEGPDMDVVEELVKDPQVKLIWTVPKYSNPDGIIYSDETIRRFAHLKPAAPDFAIIWDNAYGVHEFEGDYVPFPDILSLCDEAGRPDMVYEFASTSKITFAGGGISCMAASEANICYFTGIFGVQMISYDKVNQLRHVRFLKDKAHTLEIMKLHASVMAPKFECVAKWLNREIRPLGIAHWNDPKGGYFVSLFAMPGTAKRVWTLCKEAGVVLTNAGATYPYRNDPDDSNLRIAPSLPPVAELEKAMEVLCLSLRLAALEKLLAK